MQLRDNQFFISVSGLGLVVLGLAIFISKLDATIMRVITSFFGSIVGPLCGVFVLGLFFPWANAKVKCRLNL